MRKYINLILISIVVTLLIPDIVYGWTGTNTLCKYELTIKVDNKDANSCSEIKKQYITVGVQDGWIYVNSPDLCATSDCWECTGTNKIGPYKDLNSANKYIHLDEDSKELLLEGFCPESAYYDIASARALELDDVTYDAVCFGSICPNTDGGKYDFKERYFDIDDTTIEVQSSELIYEYAASIAETVANDALTTVKNKFVVNQNISYKENEICQSMKDEKKFTETLVNAYNTSVDEYLVNKKISQISQQYYKELIDKRYPQNEQIKIDELVQNITTQFSQLIENDSTMSDSEKNSEISKLADSYNYVKDNLDDLFKGHTFNVEVGDFSGSDTCEGFLGNPETQGTPGYYLRFIMNIIKYAAVLLAFAFSIMDFLKAVTSQDQDLLKKAISSSVKRLIFAIIIFFLPIAINYILSLVGAYSSCI